MKEILFTGSGVAIVTPFHAGAVNFPAFGRLIDRQIDGGTDAIIVCGTTGESATLTPAERNEIIRFTVERVNGRVPVIAGTGTNNTLHALEYSKTACRIGADALLVVTPYYNYNKSLDSGLLAHFRTIADNVDKPIILYNVPSRTGCNLLPATIEKLAEHPNIAAVKEASGNISHIAQVIQTCGDQLDVYSGNDDQIVPLLALGAKGVISVLSNVMPRQTHDICQLFFDGKIEQSRQLQLELLELINALFSDVNPIPVKQAMNLMGYRCGSCRLPLDEMQPQARQHLEELLRRHKLV